MLYHMHCQF